MFLFQRNKVYSLVRPFCRVSVHEILSHSGSRSHLPVPAIECISQCFASTGGGCLLSALFLFMCPIPACPPPSLEWDTGWFGVCLCVSFPPASISLFCCCHLRRNIVRGHLVWKMATFVSFLLSSSRFHSRREALKPLA